MLRILTACAMVLVVASTGVLAGDMRATTEDGKRVILKSDGTWVFEKQTAEPAPGGDLSKPIDATAVLRSKKGFCEVWYIPSKWKPVASQNPAAEYEMSHANGDGYAMLITERITMPLDSLKRVAVENAKSVAPDVQVLSDDRIVVNGANVMAMRMEGTLQGIKFTYYGYYWAGKEGTIQFLTYTGQSLFDEYRSDFTQLLNGLVITK